jgi:hypothetical protein
LLGLFFVLTSILLYPNEDGRVQNILEDFWVRVDDYKKSAVSHHSQFMTHVAKFETQVFDKLFGPELFSVQALALSCCFSLFSVSLVQLIVLIPRIGDGLSFDRYFVHSLIISVITLGVIIVATIFCRKRPAILGVVLLIPRSRSHVPLLQD